MSIQFKRKYVELTVREQKLIFETISMQELQDLAKGWEDKYKITFRQLKSGEGFTLELLSELASILVDKYAGEDDLEVKDLTALDAQEVGFMFGAISHVNDKNGYKDPKVVLK